MSFIATFAKKMLRIYQTFFSSRNSAVLELSEHIIHSDLFTSSKELHFNLNHGTCVNLCKYNLNVSLFLSRLQLFIQTFYSVSHRS